jgi:hypothetical protein
LFVLKRISSFTRLFFFCLSKYFASSANYPAGQVLSYMVFICGRVCRRMRRSVLATPIPEASAAMPSPKHWGQRVRRVHLRKRLHRNCQRQLLRRIQNTSRPSRQRR